MTNDNKSVAGQMLISNVTTIEIIFSITDLHEKYICIPNSSISLKGHLLPSSP